MGSVTVTVLGPVSITVDGMSLDLGKPQAELVLVHLLSHDRLRLGRDELLERIWPDGDPKRASHSLNVHVSELRKRLPPEIQLETTHDGYRLRIPDRALDRDLFARYIDEGMLGEALDVWSGRAFEGFVGHPGIDHAAASLEMQRRDVVSAWAESELESGRSAGLTDRLEALLRLDPFDEMICGLLMKVHYASGAPARALAVFRGITRILGEELGVEPGPELQDLEEQVLLHDPRLPRSGRPEPAITRLPVERTPMIGRERDIAGVRELLEGTHVVTVVGAGGAGKTRLAMRVAAELAEAGDVVYFVELGVIAEPDHILGAIVTAMGVSDTRGASALEVVTASLSEVRTVFVLDNCEHLISETARVVDQLVRTRRSVRVLATSREPLAVEGESLWRLPPLQTPPGGVIDESGDFESVRLFLDRARSKVPDFDPSPHAEDVVALVRRVDGLPLAIELAAALVLHMTPGEITRALDEGVDILDHGSRTAPARHRSIEEAVAWSERFMSPHERTMFRRLAVFAGRFGIDEAAAVCGFSDRDAPGTRRLLARLVEKSVVVADTSVAETSFHLLETVRAVGRARLAATGDAVDTLERYFAHYHRQARDYGWLAASHRRDEALRWANRELSNISDTVNRMYRAGEIERPLQIASALSRVITALGRYRTVVDWIEHGLTKAESTPVDPDVIASAQVVMAMAGAERAGAAEAGEAAFEYFVRSGNQVGAARAAYALTFNASLERDLGSAARWSGLAVEQARASGSDATLAWVLPIDVVYRLAERAPDLDDDTVAEAMADLDSVEGLIAEIDNAELPISLAIARVTLAAMIGVSPPDRDEDAMWVSDTPYYLPVAYDLARAVAAIEDDELEEALELLARCAETAADSWQLGARRAALDVYGAMCVRLGLWDTAAALFECAGEGGPMIVYGLYFDSQPYRQELAEHLVQPRICDRSSGRASRVDDAVETYLRAVRSR